MNTLKVQRERESSPQEPYHFTRRVGSTTFLVTAHFSQTSKETAADKIARLIRNETAYGKAANM